jgi:two-component system response regulator AlgR
MKILVVDDEPLARQRLCRMLRARAPADDIREAADGIEALEENRRFEPDVVLLDIRMPGMDGIEAARHMGQAEHPPAIVFCTAYDEYAIAAFESRAVGYLLKPVQQEKLEAVLSAAAATTRYQLQALAQAARQERRCLSSRSNSGTRLLEVAQVRVLLADQKYVSAVHPGGSLLLDESLRELEEEFGDRFLRVHRNALVARAFVRALHRDAGGEWILELEGVDTRPVVSRRHLSEVRDALERL